MSKCFGHGLSEIEKRYTDNNGNVNYNAVSAKYDALKLWYDKNSLGDFDHHYQSYDKRAKDCQQFYISLDTYREASQKGWDAVFKIPPEEKDSTTCLNTFITAMDDFLFAHLMTEDPFECNPDAYQLVKMYEE